MGVFVTETYIPYKSVPVTSLMDRIGSQSAVALILAVYAGCKFPVIRERVAVKNNDTGQGIRSVHQAGRTLKHLGTAHSLGINLYSMLVAPLLSLLTYSV